jgi:hypothetical protein
MIDQTVTETTRYQQYTYCSSTKGNREYKKKQIDTARQLPTGKQSKRKKDCKVGEIHSFKVKWHKYTKNKNKTHVEKSFKNINTGKERSFQVFGNKKKRGFFPKKRREL